jgi:ATP-dependent helicase Lhr and Lhr-like helicase
MKRHPPDVLITTPESLYLLLTSQARETLRGVEAVIVDEIHALAPTKRGTHLALSLERLEHEVLHGGSGRRQRRTRRRPSGALPSASRCPRPSGRWRRSPGSSAATATTADPRPVTIVDAGSTKPLELQVIVPVEDMSDLGQPVEPARAGAVLGPRCRRPDAPLDLAGGAPAPAGARARPPLHADLRQRPPAGRAPRRQAQRAPRRAAAGGRRCAPRAWTAIELELALAEPPNEPPPELVKAHHGSLSRERRLQVEDELKSGRLRGLVATSSLELGIDMGAVDLVVQVASPGAVSRGLQRIGRAGHQVGEPSRGVLMPKYRGDLVETAVVVRRMHDGAIEATRYPRNPLDVLAQQLVAMAAMDTWEVPARPAACAVPPRSTSCRRGAGTRCSTCSRPLPVGGVRRAGPRIVWDRTEGTRSGPAGAQRLAVTNPGTIPDRGLFGVFLPDGTRVGELDEEMVHESRPGETFVLGASTWRIEDITFERVVVTPAPGEPGKLPFWHGDGPGRPFELGAAIGAFLREVRERADDRDAEVARLRAEHDLDAWAAGQPRRLPRGAAAGHRDAARRPDHRRRAVP